MAEGVVYATGKRKTSVARVWLRPGTGLMTINRRPFESYLFRESDRSLVMGPFKVTNNINMFDVTINVDGGGSTGQAEAIRHGISRALVETDAQLRAVVKKQGFLTRDSRMKERKKYGKASARARYQYSKR
ncbi:MAG: 30S ribosomal protein S9 [Deltaproteobacteria bacterium CG23_combo_of_CG06-09_8_20_14_all_51_20]|nr:30S ribosomal protein S9 [bacterium]OIP43311.1 MAG: 30S ribosomal protein S9 [Desulfobacteraceae bacterium CG2_30_51_40]PIP48668.1 MAG: 30S ribosomal protein S9 [Deltaproteobacteria bacterium CG23_combo_of_CG06-09_8_20_14_all_51_20]PIW01479.1 MAG: 30S ribosomal protein S9 [Deltaproteobacteria bacterium CG17_big_fil_post_rev_8_21_14_2_50_51_6]PIY26783.1 MAG: 30S ribosomal protein S9 [Deltaproteobacteria bacterium CG_4_10_14_3_um_filter_51_14]PJB34773.1 MAG: 30S ribosomal protein S9 [Deltapro